MVLKRAAGTTAAWLALLCAALAQPTQPTQRPGGTIRGRVDVKRAAKDERRPAVAALGAHDTHDTHDAGDANDAHEARGVADRRASVVYLESAPQAALSPPLPRRALLDQRNESFVPRVLAVTVGSTVQFPNNDRTYHNVFSLSKPRRFDLGRYPRGQSRSVRFDQPGVVRVFCEIHSHMSAWILVFAHGFFAATDADGRYRLDGVPPGAYSLAVWNEGAVRARRELRVEGDGSVVEADFEVE